MEKKLFTYVTLGLLTWAIVGTAAAGYYFTQYNIYQSEYDDLVNQLNTNVGDISAILEGISLEANIFLSYGNGTKVWHNNTVLPLGATAFTAIYSIADDLNYTEHEVFGIFVESINGVANNNPYGWFYCYWDSKNSEWIFPNHSCAKHILHEGDTIAFTYDSWPPQPPT